MDLETDACSDHSQTSGDRQFVSGDLTFVGKFEAGNPQSRFAEIDDFWQLRAKILAASALRRGSDHLVGSTKSLEFSLKKTASSETGSSLAHNIPLF